MSKYVIKVEKVNEDGTREAYDFEGQQTEFPADGFGILIYEDIDAEHLKNTVVLHDINRPKLIDIMKRSPDLCACAPVLTLQSMLGGGNIDAAK